MLWISLFKFMYLFSSDIRWLKESCRFIQDSIACNFIWMPFVSRYFNKLPAEGNRRSFSWRQWWWWKQFGIERFRSRKMEENNRISARGAEEAIYCYSVASLSDSLCQISNHKHIRASGAGNFLRISAREFLLIVDATAAITWHIFKSQLDITQEKFHLNPLRKSFYSKFMVHTAYTFTLTSFDSFPLIRFNLRRMLEFRQK